MRYRPENLWEYTKILSKQAPKFSFKFIERLLFCSLLKIAAGAILAHMISSETNDYQSFHFRTILFIFHTKIAYLTAMFLMSKFSSLLRS